VVEGRPGGFHPFLQPTEKNYRDIGTSDYDQSIDCYDTPIQRDHDNHNRGANGVLDPTKSVDAALEVTFIDVASEACRQQMVQASQREKECGSPTDPQSRLLVMPLLEGHRGKI